MSNAVDYNVKDLQRALSDLLAALGFEAMAADALGETEHERLCRYARVILKASPPEKKRALVRRFVMLRLIRAGGSA